MTQFPNRNLTQTAVYWGNPTPDGYGDYSWDDPVEIDCRWSEEREVVKNQDGEEVISQAQVQVDQDLDQNGVLYLGALTDLDSDPIPDEVEQAYHIITIMKVPTMKGDKYFRKVYL